MYSDHRLTTTVLFYIIAVGVHQAASNWVWQWGRRALHSAAPLPDLLLDSGWASLQDWAWVPELLHALPVLHCALRAAIATPVCQRAVVHSFLVNHGCLLLLRAASFSGTLLPDASQRCENNQYVGGCHDLMFSGHVSLLLTAALHSLHFFDCSKWERWVILTCVVVTPILVILVRNHYTVDVIVAVYTTVAVFYTRIGGVKFCCRAQ